VGRAGGVKLLRPGTGLAGGASARRRNYDRRVIGGRERELQDVVQLVAGSDAGPAVLVVEGEAGIGKTTIWEGGLEAAVSARVPARSRTRQTLAALVKSHSKLTIRVLRRGKVRIAFTAPGAGTLAARLSKGRTVLAAGSHRYARPGKGSVTLKLSRKGKKALRRARKLTATLTLTFRPRSGAAISASGKVSLRR
jgi:hypothetical protein